MLYGTDTEFITTSMRHLLKDHLVLLGAASFFFFFRLNFFHSGS